MKRKQSCKSIGSAVCCVVLAASVLLQPVTARGAKEDERFYRANSNLAVSSAKTDSLDLSISTELAVTRPTEALTTSYSSYYITGTSDPAKTLTCNGEEVARPGTLGTFGYFADLKMGANTFTFKQGSQSKTVTITRVSPSSGVAKISGITQSSMLPAVHAGVKVGGSLEVSCIAPSGASVSAAFGGQTVSLKQVAVADKGVPALFKGEIKVTGSYTADVTTKVGPVSYSMTYNGSSQSYKSSGNVYVAGSESNLAVRITSFTGFIYPDVAQQAVFKEIVKKDATDYVKSQDNKYIELRSGGFVPVDQVEFIEGKVQIGNTVSSISTSNKDRYESYTFTGTSAPVYDVAQTDTALILRLYNTASAATPSVANSKLFSSVSRTENGSTVTYTYQLKENAVVWGYGVTFEGGNTTFTVRYKPKTSPDSAKPLAGVRILIDPGHGGTDPGALGVAGGTGGPAESMINLAHAYATRDRLTQLGATVYMTRDADTTRSLDARLEAIEACDADLFISLHHNSVGVNTDAGKPSGVEVYYHTGYSRSFAKTMLANVTNANGRTSRKTEQSYYRVTLLPQCPSILVELGFLSNPAEYEKLTLASQIELTAKGIANGVIVALR